MIQIDVVGTTRRIIQEVPVAVQVARAGVAGLRDGSTIEVAQMTLKSTAQKMVIANLPRIMALPGGERLALKAMSMAYREASDCQAAA